METEDILYQFQIIIGSIWFLLYFEILLHLFSMIFVLNFTTAGINSTVFLVLLTLTGISIPVVQRKIFQSKNTLYFTIVVAGVSGMLTVVPNALFSIIISLGFLYFSLPLILMIANHVNRRFVFSISYALVLEYFFQSMFEGIGFFGTVVNKTILAFLVLFWTALSLYFLNKYYHDYIESPSAQTNNFTMVMIFGYFFITTLESPYLIASWINPHSIFGLNGTNNFFYVVKLSLILFFALGAVLLDLLTYREDFSLWFLRGRYTPVILSGAFLVGLADLMWLDLITPIDIFILVYVSLTFIRESGHAYRQNGHNKLIILQIIQTLLIFLYATAGNWAFVPGVLKPIVRNNAPLFIFLTGVVVVITYLVSRGADIT